jgi:hypothetical protein
MGSYLRAVLAAITGAVVTIALAYGGALVWLVATMGIPLGSPGREPTTAEYFGLLLIGGGAAAVGGHIASGIARHQRRAVVIVLSTFLAVGALWGFTRPASQWPTWWGPALATVAAIGTWLGVNTRRGINDA